jgi:hypothetical protein
MRCAGIVLTAMVVLGTPFYAHAQFCGGAERWLVKVATDDNAASIDSSHFTVMTVIDLNKVKRPRGASSAGNSRLPEETSLVQVSGFLRFIKLEANDNDFHLVITDIADADFTPAGSGSKPSGTSLIAEAPDPTCVAGRQGDGPSASLFQSRFEAVRETISCNVGSRLEQDLSEPVVITGVRFFDFPHGQIGRARNIFEIHPIVAIEFGNPVSGCVNAPFVAPVN